MGKDKGKVDKRYYVRILLILLADIMSVIVSYSLALLVRFDFVSSTIPDVDLESLRYMLPVVTLITVGVYYAFRLYHSIWRYASVTEVYRIIGAYFVIAILMFFENRIDRLNLPRSGILKVKDVAKRYVRHTKFKRDWT